LPLIILPAVAYTCHSACVRTWFNKRSCGPHSGA